MGYSADKYGKRPSFSLLRPYIIALGIFLAALSAAPAGAGNNSLYLLQGSPTPDMAASYSVILHQWHDGGGLEKVRTVAEADTGIEFVKIYYDQRLIVIRGNDYFQFPARNIFTVLSMDRPLEEKSFKVEYPEGVANGGKHLFDIPGKGVYEEIDLHNLDTQERSFEGINLETIRREELTRDVYKHVVLYGIPGVGMPGYDVLTTFVGTEVKPKIEGHLVFPVDKTVIDTGWPLSKSIAAKRKDFIIVLVNNQNVLALLPVEDQLKDTKSLGHAKIYVLNKNTGEWDFFQVKGNSTGARGFKKWIGGYVESTGFQAPNPQKKKRPSKTERKGIPSERRLKNHGIYAPGILYIYNPDTRKKYEIETGDADSEVLLVEGDYVYYRVYDEIYKAKIGKDKLEEPVLLVKDDAVPDIHWAFFGPKVDVQTEVQTR